jgi:hypothetical protein
MMWLSLIQLNDKYLCETNRIYHQTSEYHLADHPQGPKMAPAQAA